MIKNRLVIIHRIFDIRANLFWHIVFSMSYKDIPYILLSMFQSDHLKFRLRMYLKNMVQLYQSQ